MIDADRVLYFGCFAGTGHYLRNRHMVSVHRSAHPWAPAFTEGHIDGGFCPYARKPCADAGPQNEGEAMLHHVEGWTVLAFWDRSVDKRGGSNSALIAPGSLSFADMVDLFKRLFPAIWWRFTFEVRPFTSMVPLASEVEIEDLRAALKVAFDGANATASVANKVSAELERRLKVANKALEAYESSGYLPQSVIAKAREKAAA